MNKKRTILVFLVLSAVGIGVGWVFKNSIEFGICLVSEPICINQLTNIGDALFYSTQALAIVFLYLLFAPQAFNFWKKFAIWYIPLMYIYFFLYKNEGFFSIPEETVYRFLSILYAVVSVILISFVVLKKDNK